MNIDRILIVGKLVSPVELRLTNKGTHAANLIIENRRHYRGLDGSRNLVISNLPINVYGSPAQHAHAYLKVGDSVLIEGHHRAEERPNGGLQVNIVADFIDYENNPRGKEASNG